MNNSVSRRLMRRPAVEEATGLPRATIYAEMRLGRFPPPVPVSGTRVVAWPSDEIAAWVDATTAGASVEEKLQLVSRLVAERTAAAQKPREGARHG